MAPTNAPSPSTSPSSSPTSNKAMDDQQVWQEINLPSLDETSNHNNLNIPSSNFQDFLPPSPALPPPPASGVPRAVVPARSRPVPILSLFSGSDFGYLSGEVSTGSSCLRAAVFGAEGASSSKKRPPLDGKKSEVDERKRERRIKNRESANRSRARKMAYAQELEMEVDKLKTENAKLKQKLSTEQPQLTKKKKLCRTLSAPF